MINAQTAYCKTKSVEVELNKIKSTEITKAIREIEVMITDAIKRGEYSIAINGIPGLSDQTFSKISGILVTTLKEYGYRAEIIRTKSYDYGLERPKFELVINWAKV